MNQLHLLQHDLPEWRPVARRVRLAGSTAVVVASVAWLASDLPMAPASQAAPDHRAQCEQSAGSLADELATAGVDLRGRTWQQGRDRSIQACVDGFPDLRWLLNDR